MVERILVGADDEVGVDAEAAAARLAGVDARHPPALVPADVRHGDAVADLGAGGDGGIDEQRIEHPCAVARTARRRRGLA